MAADDINIAEEAFRKYDEHVIEDDPLDHKIHHSFRSCIKCLCLIRFLWPSQCDPQTGFSWPMCDRRTLRRYDPGGQREHFHIFKNETAHKTSDGTGTGRRHQRKDMEMKIRAVDRKRRDYYQYYTGNTWEEPRIIIFAWTAV